MLNKKIKFYILLLFFVMIFFPLCLTIFYSYNSQRDRTTIYYKKYSSLLSEEINKFTDSYYNNLYMMLNNDISNIDMKEAKKLGIQNAFKVGKNYILKFSYYDNQYPELLKKELNRLDIDREISSSGFIISRSTSVQYVFRKITADNSFLYSGEDFFNIFEIDTSYFKNNIKLPENYTFKIYNGEYKCIYDSSGGKLFKTEINPITKKMLDGEINTEINNNTIYSYRFFNLNNGYLYFLLSSPDNLINSELRSIILFYGLIFFLTLIFSFFFIMHLLRKISMYMEKTLLKEHLKSNNTIYSKFMKDLESSLSDIDQLIKIENQFEDLKLSFLDLRNIMEGDDADEKENTTNKQNKE